MYIGDWSSDVCSSDLILCLAGVSVLAGLSLWKLREGVDLRKQASLAQGTLDDVLQSLQSAHIYHLRAQLTGSKRSEERRVGKERRQLAGTDDEDARSC